MPRLISVSCCILAASTIFQPPQAQVPGFPAPDWTYQSNHPTAALGTWVAAAGDVNGDGFDDVLVSATGYDGAGVDEGIVLLFFGSAVGLASSPDWSVTGVGAGAQLSARARTGDINGDGYDDVLLSDGRLCFGSATGMSSGFQATTVRNYVGRFVAADVDGDGYGDIALSLDLWSGSPSGLSQRGSLRTIKDSVSFVLSDLTADGDVDQVIATDNGELGMEGGAIVMFSGGSRGPSRKKPFTSPFSWHSASPLLSAAGDLDGDGHSDFLLGLFGDPDVTPIPRMFSELYHFRGSSRGYEAPASLFYFSGGERLNHFDGAGNVNGDSYDDLLIVDEGAQGQRVQLFAGGPGAPAAIAALSGVDVRDRLFSRPASGVGDVNGDGYDDLMVGWPGFSDGEAGEGRVTLYLGSASWPAATAR